ncbi:hypothetical protein GCM10023310_70530 [Paenibacillus vulneris]|uniref:Uncharacterized protein n=1 Tax=Paenibacillus vulneris TaxID=1133364 RepID=A0ABW3UIU7_9BACL
MNEEEVIDIKKVEFMKFRYADLLGEDDKLQEGVVYAGDFQFLMSCIDTLLKK